MIARAVIRLLRSAEKSATRRELVPGRIARILLVETTRFGDLIAALSVLPRFQATFPDASLTLLVHPDHVPVLPALGVPCDVIPFPWPSDKLGCIGAMMQVHERHYDLVCSMSPSAKNALFALLSPATVRSGYLDGKSSLTPFRDDLCVESTGLATASIRVSRGTNLYERAARVADHLGCDDVPATSMKIPAAFDARWPALAASIGFDVTRPFIAIHPFAAWKYRTWPMDAVRALAALLHDAYPPVQVVLLGTPEDALQVSRQEALPSGALFFATRDWSETAVLLAHATAFVGTDSGPLHLASALGTRVVGLFGPASPALTAAPGPGRTDLHVALPCAPCDQVRCVLPVDPCMPRIQARQVFDALTSFLVRTDLMVANA